MFATAQIQNNAHTSHDREAFSLEQSDWEFQLDTMFKPTLIQLKNHLAIVPAGESNGETALFLQSWITRAESLGLSPADALNSLSQH